MSIPLGTLGICYGIWKTYGYSFAISTDHMRMSSNILSQVATMQCDTEKKYSLAKYIFWMFVECRLNRNVLY